MATKKILIIDDEKIQAQALASELRKVILASETFVASTEEEIEDNIQNKFYNLAIIDIRMDGYSFDGIDIAKKIIEINPFAKILFVSRFVSEYISRLTDMMANGKVLGFSEKKDYTVWTEEIKSMVDDYYAKLDSEPSEVNNALVQYYSEVKNETDAYTKGWKFENFISILFRSIGFENIMKRVIDKSLNEVDLIIRNDIKDPFLSKFGKYILIECKNKPEAKVDKNDFIAFQSKLENTNGLSEIGFIFSTSSFTRNTYIEALRSSCKQCKVIFIDNILMGQLLLSFDLKEGLKKIIDNQVKDN